jgi:hypothetical protein
MEAGEAALYLFSACAFATLLWHPGSPVERYLPSDAVFYCAAQLLGAV